jgi:hypothetical protein
VWYDEGRFAKLEGGSAMSATKGAGDVEAVAAESPSTQPAGDGSADEPVTRPWAEYAAMPIEEQLAEFEKSWAVKSVAAFRRDLPELLRVAEGKWVLYVRGQRVRIADESTELYAYCMEELRLNEDEYVVCYIHGGEYEGAVEMSGR